MLLDPQSCCQLCLWLVRSLKALECWERCAASKVPADSCKTEHPLPPLQSSQSLQGDQAAGLACPLVFLIFVFSAPQGIFLFSLIKYTPLKYNDSYKYPPWGYMLGWLMALSSMVCIPLYAIFILLKTKGSLKQVLGLWSLGVLLLLPQMVQDGPQGGGTQHISPLRRQGLVRITLPQNAL